jgi:hypothetical protein
VIDDPTLDDEAADLLASPPEGQKSVDELIAATGGGANAIFDFRHKVFALPGARFAREHRAGATMFFIKLGNLTVSLTPLVLRREFNIEISSLDSQLIELASQALRHVKEIRPGDSIPKELIDGTASWAVEDRHRLLAKAKLLAQVATLFAPEGTAIPVEEILANVETDVVAREELQSAFAELARSLGLDRGRKQEIIDNVDSIARELCYIEALRDHAAQMRTIYEKVLQLSRMAKGDPEISEGLSRVQVLLKQPVAEFANRFGQIDSQTSDLLEPLRNPRAHIKMIRDARDDIHSRLLPWNDIFDRWRNQELILDHDTDENIHTLYHWLAANYAPARVWR